MRKFEQVLVELLQTKELNEVRVSDLCKLTGLNRSTFYANYEDIYALADQLREKLELEVAALDGSDDLQGFTSNNYLRLFQLIAQNQALYQTYFKLGYDEQYRIWQYDTQLAEKYFDNRFISYHMEFFKSGLTKIIKMWLEKGCRETPEEMFEIIKSEYRGRDF